MLYFHGAAEGKKMDLVRQTGYAGFEMDTAHGLKTADQACGYSFRYRSVVGEGPIRVVEETQEKKKGLNCIMGHMSGKDSWDYPEAMLKRTAVLRLDVEQMSGKRTGLGGCDKGGRICLSQDAESAAINVKERKRSAVRDAQPWKSPSGAVSAVLNPAARQKG